MVGVLGLVGLVGVKRRIGCHSSVREKEMSHLKSLERFYFLPAFFSFCLLGNGIKEKKDGKN